MNEDEKRAHALLNQAYALYFDLPDRDSCDDSEMCEAIHRFQNVLAMRVARRVDPGFWKIPDGGWSWMHGHAYKFRDAQPVRVEGAQQPLGVLFTGGIPPGDKPQFDHDCGQCTFLGLYDTVLHGQPKVNGARFLDLYFCPKPDRQTMDELIARYGNDGPEYTAFKVGCGTVPTAALAECYRRATAQGLVREPACQP